MWFSLTRKGIRCAYLARHGAQHAQRGRDRVAPALHGQLADVPRIEVDRIRRERRPRRVLNALVDRQNRQVAGPGQPSVAQNLLKAAQHLNYILVMLFLKYISDLWNDHVETYRKRYGGNDARIRRRLDRECHIYLISRFASDAGKKAGEFYTPSAVSQLLAKLAAIDRDLDRVLSEWTEALVENLNDPTTTDQMQLLGTQQRQLVEGFSGGPRPPRAPQRRLRRGGPRGAVGAQQGRLDERWHADRSCFGRPASDTRGNEEALRKTPCRGGQGP